MRIQVDMSIDKKHNDIILAELVLEDSDGDKEWFELRTKRVKPEDARAVISFIRFWKKIAKINGIKFKDKTK